MAAQQAQINTRPRTKTMLSFGSHKSGGSGPKIDLVETAKEKAHRRMTSKADPNKAMDEAQPVMQALEKSTMESLRSMQHRDIHGNIITDPDRSNPTRPRLERPLDTIRSFEAAIDGSYNRRQSMRPPVDGGYQSRRSSYYQGYNNGYNYNQQRESYYGNRMGPSRPESYVDGYGSGYRQSHSPAPFNPPRQRFGPRNHSDPALYGNNSNGVYTNQNYQSTYDTVTTTGSGSGNSNTEPWSNSTDPSSENSSLDRINQAVKPDLAETYGFSGFGGAPQFQGPMLEEPGRAGPAYGQQGYRQNGLQQGYGHQGNDVPPPPPPHLSKRPVGSQPLPKLPTSQSFPRYDTNGYNKAAEKNISDAGGKRKSWLRRRFSKNG